LVLPLVVDLRISNAATTTNKAGKFRMVTKYCKCLRNVEAARRVDHKKHEVWKLSFDWKLCNSRVFIKQKLNYMPARRAIQAGMTIM